MEEIKTAFVASLKLHSFRDVSDAVAFILRDGRPIRGSATAINAEKIVKANSDPEIMSLLDRATMRYADGIAVVWSLRRQHGDAGRVPGCELWEALLLAAVEYETPVYIVGGSEEVNRLTAEKLGELGSNVVGRAHGYFADRSAVMEEIALKKPAIVSVAMGSPLQEKFIEECSAIWPDAFYMGVGGSYDVFVGRVKRAPKWMRNNNLEWLYRLVKEPTRLFRQKALLKYLYLHWRRQL